jgi:hypothetical protein
MKLPGLVQGPVREFSVTGREAFLCAADHALAFARDAKRCLDIEQDELRGLALNSTIYTCAIIAANLRTMARATKP